MIPVYNEERGQSPAEVTEREPTTLTTTLQGVSPLPAGSARQEGSGSGAGGPAHPQMLY